MESHISRRALFRSSAVLAGVALFTAVACSRPGAPGAPAGLSLRPGDAAAVLADARRPGAKAVLVNVWATWCQPCVEEFPDIMRLYSKHRERGLRLVLVSADFEDQREAARVFLERHGVDFPTWHKSQSDEPFIDEIDARWSGALPAGFVLDGNGAVRDLWEGKLEYDEIERRVLAVLENH